MPLSVTATLHWSQPKFIQPMFSPQAYLLVVSIVPFVSDAKTFCAGKKIMAKKPKDQRLALLLETLHELFYFPLYPLGHLYYNSSMVPMLLDFHLYELYFLYIYRAFKERGLPGAP